MRATELTYGDATYLVRWDHAVDISIPLQFDGPQPTHFGASQATSEPMRAGEFVGDTRQGGSCNARVYTLNAHCNGTHTECVAHVCNQPLSVCEIAPRSPQLALLASIAPRAATDCADVSDPPPKLHDILICVRDLRDCFAAHPELPYKALVLRTLPNDVAKRSQVYADSTSVPYFSAEAAGLLVETGIEHLLVDTPSIDRLNDDGKLTAHRIFWGLPGGGCEQAAAARATATVTEMVFVPDSLRDGPCLLNLQVAPFCSDAAPARPLLYPLESA